MTYSITSFKSADPTPLERYEKKRAQNNILPKATESGNLSCARIIGLTIMPTWSGKTALDEACARHIYSAISNLSRHHQVIGSREWGLT